MYMVHPLYLAQHESKPYCFQGFFTYFIVPNRSPGPNKRTSGRISSNNKRKVKINVQGRHHLKNCQMYMN